MKSEMAYMSRISSLSSSSFTSFGSSDTILTEPLQMNSSFFLNNSIAFGSRLGPGVLACFSGTDNSCKATVSYFGFCRLEMLQQIANRVQRDCVNGEDKLALARTALQSVSFEQYLFDLMKLDIM